MTAADLFYTEQNYSDPSRVKIPFTFRISMYEPSENEILFDFSNRHAWKLRKKNTYNKLQSIRAENELTK